MKRGFTLFELIIVIVILAILAALGFNQYTRVVEKGRTAEAKGILSSIRTAQIGYKFEKGIYATSFNALGLNAPTACDSQHYFCYDMVLDAGNERARAWRCGSGGKTPNYTSGEYVLVIRFNGTYYASRCTGYYPDQGSCTEDRSYW